MEGEAIDVRSHSSADGSVALHSSWRHPGPPRLGLAALCVEVNARRGSRPWTMPATIGEVEAKLEAVGIGTTPQLAEALADGSLNQRLEDASQVRNSDYIVSAVAHWLHSSSWPNPGREI